MLRPLEPVATATRIWLGILFFVLFVSAWSWATLGGYVSSTFLANPLTMLDEGWQLLVRHGLSATDKLVAKPKPEAKAGDLVTIEAAGAKP